MDKVKVERVKCTCACHREGGEHIKHVVPCCENGFIEVPILDNEKAACHDCGEVHELSDWNGKGFMLCKGCADSHDRFFDEEYR